MKPLRIIIMAKAPRVGLVKTRLIPALGASGAAELAQWLLKNTINEALAAKIGPVELCRTPHDDVAWNDSALPLSIELSDQGEGDLGVRMARVAERVTSRGEAIVLIGTDCPSLNADVLIKIATRLQTNDCVIAPATDGGYVALGLNRFHPSLFSDIAWSTSDVAFETICRIGQLGWKVELLHSLHDIDDPDDLRHLPNDINFLKPLSINIDI